MNKLVGKTILITEAAGTIGNAIALSTAKEGACVICTSANLEKLTPIISKIKENGGTAIALEHTSNSQQSWENSLSFIIKTYGKIDCFVNCASIISPKMLLSLTNDDFNTLQNTVINPFIYGSKQILPLMVPNNCGSIINISTIEGLVGLDEHHPYTAIKEVLRSYTLDVAYEYAPYNIRVNSICPSVVNTPLLETTFPIARPYYKKYVQFPDFGSPENVAKWVIYLASDEASFITGAEIVIDSDQIIQ
ncbi:SDR family oxidoreductase [Enterococcus sp. DIV0242_7C1]|uniref:SDR family NAD(P)-dependent oxidoreductase n=1 Tax=Enterococcus TaxID=1350 RepID=UPI000B3E9BD6|nr:MULTISPECIES: SDR family oxidoreductase [unclassified Enterococcus]MBO0470523.1 SDR family oxidoreductase [Enterococcus sp. DIV0242_7C1]